MTRTAVWPALASVLLLSACGAVLDPGEEEGATERTGQANKPLDTGAPIFLFYGTYDGSGASAATRALVRYGSSGKGATSLAGVGEPVLAINRPLGPTAGNGAELDAWRALGGRVAHVISRDKSEATLPSLEALLQQGVGSATQVIVGLLSSGFDYVAVDELNQKSSGWVDGGGFAAAFEQLLSSLAAAGYDRRVILYVNSYNLVPDPAQPSRFSVGSFKQVLRACRDHCRVVASEIYVRTRFVLKAGAETPGHCTRNTACFEKLAQRFEAAAPGINGRLVTVLGLSDVYSEASAQALCHGPGGAGALYRQYAALHQGSLTRQQPGVGGYTLAAVTNGTFSTMDQARCLHDLSVWSAWPRAATAAGAALVPPPAVQAPAPAPPSGPHEHVVSCHVFSDGYNAMQGPSDAIFGRQGDANACMPGGADGICRRWFGRCTTDQGPDGHHHDVVFYLFDTGYAQMIGPTDAIALNGNHSICGPGLGCRQYFGRGVTSTTVNGVAHGHQVHCRTFEDGYYPISGYGDAITWFGGQLCVPGFNCHRWFGRCKAQ